MKAVAVFPAERRIGVVDHPEPQIASPTQVKLRMLDVGICGTDKEIGAFDYGTAPEGSPYLVIGHESLGEVVEIGAAVTQNRLLDWPQLAERLEPRGVAVRGVRTLPPFLPI